MTTDIFSERATSSLHACPCCDLKDRLEYQVHIDQYVCFGCGLISTVNEVFAHGCELAKQAA